MTDLEKLKALAAFATIGDKPATTPTSELIGAMDAYRAGVPPAILLGLIGEIEALQVWVEDLALSLECEVKARYAGSQSHPAIKRKYDGDMQEVIDARALIALQKLTWNQA